MSKPELPFPSELDFQVAPTSVERITVSPARTTQSTDEPTVSMAPSAFEAGMATARQRAPSVHR